MGLMHRLAMYGTTSKCPSNTAKTSMARGNTVHMSQATQLEPAWHAEMRQTCHADNRGCQGRKRSCHTQGRGAVMKHTHGHCRLGHMERTHCQSKPCDGHSTLRTCPWAQVPPCADTRSGPGACCFVHGRNAAKASLWGPPDQLYYSCRRRGYASQQ